ncbi:MAG: efflux RND transporter permease subunit [Acidobacteriota bacterium]
MLDLVLRRPVSVSFATLGLVVLGIFSATRLPVSLLPTLERPRLQVIARDDDRAREALLREVVMPLERRLQSLPGTLDVYSTVADGECVVTLETEWQTDTDRLRIDAERRLAEVSSLGLDELIIKVDAGDRTPILRLAVVGGASAHARTAFAEKVLTPELGRLRGAGELRTTGGARLRAVVRPRAADLAARGLTADEIVIRLGTLGSSRPLGRLRDGGAVRPVILKESLADLDSLRGTSLGGAGATRLGDVADVALEEVPDPGIFRLDGQDAVLVEVFRAPGANAVRLAVDGRDAVERLSKSGSGMEIRLVDDASREVTAALTQLGWAGLVGLLLGTVILRALLGSWRPTLALVAVVPSSLVAAFGAFYLWGVSLDVVSLAGLALAAGMLVDNAVVVLESIASARGRREDDPVLGGTAQIAGALVASFLTTAVVFVPLIYLKGLARAFFGVQAFAIVSSLAISLALSLTLTPILSRRLGDGGGRGRHPGRRSYLRLLDGLLDRPALTLAAAGIFLTACAWLAVGLPRELVPAGASDRWRVDIRAPAGLGRDEVDARLRGLEQAMGDRAGVIQRHLRFQGTDGDAGRQGTDDAGLGQGDLGAGDLELVFGDPTALGAARDDLRRRLEEVPGLQLAAEARRSAISAAVERTRRQLLVDVSAATPERVEALARRVQRALGEGGYDAARVHRYGMLSTTAAAAASPSLELAWRADRMARLGLAASDLDRQIRSALGGRRVGRLDLEGAEPEIWLAAAAVDPRLVPVKVDSDADGRVLPLAAFAHLRRRTVAPPLERHDGRPTRYLAVDGEADAQVVGEIEDLLRSVPLAAGEGARLSGQTRELRASFQQLRWALGLALLLVFLTVAALYESLMLPLVVMVTVPVGGAGAVLALAATGQSLNVMSLLGMVLLAGIVVNNAIVLIHRAEQLGGDGAALRSAAAERYRPILMTTLTTLLGMLPLAILGGDGLELRRALAIAVVGGLTTSWAATLLVVPACYRWVRIGPRGAGR